jgi:pimeloyl-ACP methyl ester carboxylesterase
VIPIEDAAIETWERGSGSPVVIVPAAGRSLVDYADLGAALAEAGHRAVAINPRGVGESTGLRPGLTLHDFASDVAGVVETLGIAPVHVVGHAWGQRMVRVLAADHPALLRSVTLLAAGGRFPPDPSILGAAGTLFDTGASAEQRRQALQTVFFAPGNDCESWIDGWLPEALADQAAAALATPVEEWWAVSGPPVLVIQGLQDAVAGPENGRATVAAARDGRLVELEGAGHALIPEQPEAIAGHIVDFLREVESVE